MSGEPQDEGPASGDAEAMRYGLLGEDGSTTGEKLEKYTGEVEWRYLRPHFRAGVLLYVDASLELAAVGEALTADDVDRVEQWRRAGDLITPSEPHARYWDSTSATFRALVVSPFVLIQAADGGVGGGRPAGPMPDA